MGGGEWAAPGEVKWLPAQWPALEACAGAMNRRGAEGLAALFSARRGAAFLRSLARRFIGRMK
ncbi:MAG TPA: hypothetical protein VFL79_13915 [Terriglobia bacterium]|nr:hypothetical protein [Terriglobia bacterium]